MTIDMLAATFFWPEGTLLGAQAVPGEAMPEDRVPRDPSCDADEVPPVDGFWAGVARHLWRPAVASAESLR